MECEEESLAKPDLVLVTKNVMVPLALPVSRSKSILGSCMPKKKTEVGRPRKNRALAEQTLSLCRDDEGRRALKKRENFQRRSEETHDKSDCKFVPRIPCNDKNKLGISSLSLQVPDAKREISSSSCAKFAPNARRASDVERRDVENVMKNLRRKGSDWLIFRNDIESRESSATEIRCSSSSNVNRKFSYTRDDRANEDANCRIKYSWEDLENWVPPSEKKKILECNEKYEKPVARKQLDCGIKYSWQIIGKTVQTSRTLMEYIRRGDERGAASNYPCAVKYSWQIIGTGTQVSFRENGKNSARTETNYWDGKILKASERSKLPRTIGNEGFGKFKIAYNERTQTTADKVLQTDTSDCRIKYSWQNLTKAYLKKNKYP